MAKVFNRDDNVLEIARVVTCPRCLGKGSVPIDDKEDADCYICNGVGRAVKAIGSDWTRPINCKETESMKY